MSTPYYVGVSTTHHHWFGSQGVSDRLAGLSGMVHLEFKITGLFSQLSSALGLVFPCWPVVVPIIAKSLSLIDGGTTWNSPIYLPFVCCVQPMIDLIRKLHHCSKVDFI